MILVRLLPSHLKTKQGDDGGAGIGEVVEGISGDGDGAAQGTGEEFAGKQYQVEDNA